MSDNAFARAKNPNRHFEGHSGRVAAPSSVSGVRFGLNSLAGTAGSCGARVNGRVAVSTVESPGVGTFDPHGH